MLSAVAFQSATARCPCGILSTITLFTTFLFIILTVGHQSRQHTVVVGGGKGSSGGVVTTN